MADHNEWMLFGGGFMWVLWVLFIFIIILLLKFLVDNTISRQDNSNEDILKQRLAKGELSEQEYHRLKKEIDT